MRTRLGSFPQIGKALRALAVGVAVGVCSVTAFEFLKAALTRDSGSPHMLSLSGVASATMFFSIYYALQIVAVSVPLWFLLARLRLAGPYAATALGAVVTFAIWTYNNPPMFVPLMDGLPYAICGGLAGLAAWIAGH